MIQGQKIYEMDFAITAGAAVNVGDPWPVVSIRVAPHCPFRQFFISMTNSANTTSDVTGYITAYYQGKVVYKQVARFYSGTAPTTLTSAGGVVQQNRTANAVGVEDSFVISRPGTTNIDTIPHWSMFMTADEIRFEPVQQTVGASGVATWFMACKSAQGMMA